jgi:Kdo2-lipid IVA lauroyltransferase/acyltransferase
MISFYIFKILEAFLMILPHKMRKAFFIFLANVAYAIDKKHRKIVKINLDATLKDLSEAEKTQISRSCYKNLMMNFLQIMEAKRLTNEEVLKKVTFENKERLDELLGKPFIFSLSHYNNWELLGEVLAIITDNRSNAVYKKLNNEYFDTYLKDSRERFGVKMHEKRGALRYLSRALRNKDYVGLLTDQNTNERDGIIIKFFGKDAYQSSAISDLSKKYDAPILPVSIHSEDFENYVITFHEVIHVDKSDDHKADILKATQKQVEVLQNVIKQDPRWWFWCHKRYKSTDSKMYEVNE